LIGKAVSLTTMNRVHHMRNKTRPLPEVNSYLIKFEVAKRNLSLQTLEEQKKKYMTLGQEGLRPYLKTSS
jgi:hypothetical protein